MRVSLEDPLTGKKRKETDMSNWNVGNNWQLARWTWNIARNMRITEPEGFELAFLRAYLQFIWDPMTRTGLRPWLDTAFKSKAIAAAGGIDYECDLSVEPANVIVECLNVVGRDFKKIPVGIPEMFATALLIMFTGNRRYGTGPYFGGVAGSEYVGG